MADHVKMAVVGERDAVLAFKAVGMTALSAERAEDIARAVHNLAREGTAVIFITERAAGQIPEILAQYQSEPFPAIIPVPGIRGNTGLGMRNLRANAEKAIGSDILFSREG